MRNSSQDRDNSNSLRPSSAGGNNAFSPTNTSQISNILNQRGPIRPQNIMQSMGQQVTQPPQTRDFIRQDLQQQHTDDDYYGEEEEEGKSEIAHSARRILSPQEEMRILQGLMMKGSDNREFKKVMEILQNDGELRPLIYEHQTLLGCLTGIKELRAEYMLSILTAAETEMYENSRQKDEGVNQELNERNTQLTQERDELVQKTQTASFEIEKLKKLIQGLEQDKMTLSGELQKEKNLRETIEKERECTFKNLFDENQNLKKLNETLKKTETETKKQLEQKEREFRQELENLKQRLQKQEELRKSMLQEKDKFEIDLQKNENLIQNLEKEIQLLEKENDNLHRKMNSTFNSILFQSHINQQHLQGLRENTIIGGDANTPARRNLSSSFQNSGLIEKQNNSALLGQPAFAYGHSTQRLKMLMSENNKSSYIAHSIYYGGIGQNKESNPYFQRNDSLVRSNSIEVILLDDEESKKQNAYLIGEDEKQISLTSGILGNKHSWLKTKGLFTDLSPINSISSQQMDPSTSRQVQQQQRRLQDVEEEHTEILGTYQGRSGQASPYNPTQKYYDEQVKKLQLEIEKLKEENKELTQKVLRVRTDESPLKTHENQNLLFGTPQTNTGFMNQRGHETGGMNPQIVMSNNINPMYSNEQSPIMMATFSQEKDRRFHSQYNQNAYQSQQSSVPKGSEQISEKEKFLQQQMEYLENDLKQRLLEIGGRLIQLLKKLSPSPFELQKFQTQDYSVSLIKDIIYEISTKLDTFIELQQSHPSRSVNSGQYIFTQQQPFQYQPQYPMPQQPSYGLHYAGSFASHPNSTTMDMTPMDLRNMLLMEKEKRIEIQEELYKTKEVQLKFQTENEKLKLELFNEKQQNQTMHLSYLDPQSSTLDQIHKNLTNVQSKYEQIQEENINLKLKIGELEGELHDERQKYQSKIDFTLNSLKNQAQSGILDTKMQYEERLMAEKEKFTDLRLQYQSLVERNQLLNDSLIVYRERIAELEKENFSQHKENYTLQNELDYETLKASQLQQKRDQGKQQVSAPIIQEKIRLQERIDELERKVHDQMIEVQHWQLKAKKHEDQEHLNKLSLEEQIKRLKINNERLIDENKNLQNLNLSSKSNIIQESNQLNKVMKDHEQKMAALRITHSLKLKENIRKLKAYYRLIINRVLANSSKQLKEQSLISFNQLNDGSQQKINNLENELQTAYNQNNLMAMQIGKILRNSNLGKPIKLSFAGALNSNTFQYVLSGLKNNQNVVDLNLYNCQLDDDDLIRLQEVLSFEQAIQSLKIGKNQFTNAETLIEIIVLKSKQLKYLDISYSQFDSDALTKLPKSLQKMEVLQNLQIAGIINQQLSSMKESINYLFKIVFSIKSLRGLDISKNKLSKESLNYMLQNIKSAQNIESLSLSQINLGESEPQGLINMINNQRNLRKLNLSSNNLYSSIMVQILNALKIKGMVEDLDLSKNQFDGQSIQALGDLIVSNKNLTTLYLQKIGLTDQDGYALIQPLSDQFNIENLKLDFNKFSSVFIEKLCSKFQQNKPKHGLERPKSRHGQSNSSFLNDDSESSILQGEESKKQKRNKGFASISLEGNNIGDRGAKALAQAIRIPLENTIQLKMINLNECGITNDGFEELRNALMERGNLAQTANLTHVKITIERNNINY